MPFVMNTSQAMFRPFISMNIAGLEGSSAYINDAIIYSDNWKQHLEGISTFFDILNDAKQTKNLAKSDCCHASSTFPGYVVGQGRVKPMDDKIEAISNFPIPTCKRQLMRFPGRAGYYRKFRYNFSVNASRLTNLLRKRLKFHFLPRGLR